MGERKREPHRQTLRVVDPGHEAVVMAVGGGKGGVGKSMVTSNLAVVLALRSYRTLLVDGDLGAANLHSFLGIEGSRLSLSSYLKGEIDDFRSLVRPSMIVEGLDIVTGARDSLDVADISSESVARLRSALQGMGYDYILLDLGPGTSANVLDMLFFADNAVILASPDPMAVENTYRYLKALILRRVKASLRGGALKEVLTGILKGPEGAQIRTVADIIALLRRAERVEGEYLGQLFGATRLSLIMNQLRRNEDSDAGSKIEALCADSLGLKVSHIGNIPYDDVVVDSVVQRKPVSIHFKGTKVCTAIEQCADVLIEKTRAGRKASRRCPSPTEW